MKVFNQKIRSIKPEDKVVSLKEMKNFLKVDHDEDNEFIKELITTATEMVEGFLNKKILKTQLKYSVMVQFTKLETAEIQSANLENSQSVLKLNLPLKSDTVTENLYIGSEKIDRDDYTVSFENRKNQQKQLIIRKRVVSDKLNEGTAEISLFVSSGMYECANDVSSPIKLAVMVKTAELYDSRDHASAFETAKSRLFVRLLRPFMSYELV